MKFTLLYFLFLLSISPSLIAKELDRGAVPFIAEGVVVTTSPIRQAPPHGLFNLFLGKEIESTKQGSSVKIIGRKTYGGFLGVNVWYQLESANNLTSAEHGPLWIYGGVEGEPPQIKIQRQILNGGGNGN